MLKKIFTVVILLLVTAGLAAGCGKGGEGEEALYQVVDPSTLGDAALMQWYESSCRLEGSHSTNGPEGYKYLVISAGEKRTGGYSVEVYKAEKGEAAIVVFARLKTPGADQIVTQALTYPHALVKVKAGERENVTGKLEKPDEETAVSGAFKGVPGTYTGQIDNNFIEIVIQPGVLPDAQMAVSFKVPDKMKGILPGFDSGDRVKLDCFKNSDGQWEIISLAKEAGTPPGNLQAGPQVQTDRGAYTGQIDGNSVEIKLNGKAVAFRLTEDLKAGLAQKNLKTGEEVFIRYYEDSYGRLVLTQIDPDVMKSQLSDSDFKIGKGEKQIKLGQWDSDIDLEEILGKPLAVSTEQLGAGADTFTGSYIRIMKYGGLELGLMSPKDNGRTFFIDMIKLTGGDLTTSRGVRVGDGYQDLLAKYPYQPPDPAVPYDKQNWTYEYNDGAVSHISFEVKQGKISLITLFILHP